MDQKQQEKYEALVSEPSLYLAALKFDELRLTVDAYRWSFLSLSDLISRWADSDDDLARMPADETAQTLQGWDDKIFGVFASPDSGNQIPLNGLFGHPVGGSWGESAGGEEHAEAVVLAVAIAAGEAAVELDDPVDRLGAAVVRAARGEVRQER